MPRTNQRRRGVSVAGMWKIIQRPKDLTGEELVEACIRMQPVFVYTPLPDALFPGTWKVEPMRYQGQGLVYLFHGERAKEDAIDWSKEKNRRRT